MTECIKFLRFAPVHESFFQSRHAFLKAFEAGSFFVEVMVCDFHTGDVPNDASCHKEEVCVGFSVYVRHTLRCEYFGGPERTVLRTHERGHGRHSEPNWRNGRCLVSLESPAKH